MGQRSIEILVGRLVTDEELRQRFIAAPLETLRLAQQQGLELTAAELDALLASPVSLWTSLAAVLDERLQKASLKKRGLRLEVCGAAQGARPALGRTPGSARRRAPPRVVRGLADAHERSRAVDGVSGTALAGFELRVALHAPHGRRAVVLHRVLHPARPARSTPTSSRGGEPQRGDRLPRPARDRLLRDRDGVQVAEPRLPGSHARASGSRFWLWGSGPMRPNRADGRKVRLEAHRHGVGLQP